MTGRDLVLAAVRGEPVPRVPTGPLAVHFCARLAGHSLRRYSTDAAALADSVLRYHERFKPDAVWISADTWVSAEAMGAEVGSDTEAQPLAGLGPPLVGCLADLDRIPPPDVVRQGRYPMMLEAVRRVAGRIGSDTCIVACFDQFPFSLASALMGVEVAMLAAIEDPPFLRAVMARAQEYALAYGRALAAAGADILSGGDSPAGLLGSDLYAALAQPSEKRLIDALREATGKPVSLHVCGNATPILRDMTATGADILELDHAVDVEQACRRIGPGTALWGNLDPVALLAQGTAERVRAAAEEALESVRRAGHRRFVLSSGCTLAVETPDANLDALLRAGSA